MFFDHQHDLKESDRGSPNHPFYKVIWRSVNQFGKETFLKKSSFRWHWNQNSAWIQNIWRNIGEDIERILAVKFSPNLPTGYLDENIDTGHRVITKQVS